MKLKIDYETLVSKLDYVQGIIEDNMLHNDMRNFIFQISQNEVKVIGYNINALCKTNFNMDEIELNVDETDLTDGYFYMQLKAKELTGLLGSYKTSKRTKANSVTFESAGLRIKVTVDEESLDGLGKVMTSKMNFDNLPVQPAVKQSITVATKEGIEFAEVSSSTIQLYIESLLPVLKNEGSNSIYSKMNFAEDKVICMHTAFASVFDNMLPKAFQEVVLSYSAIAFLKKLIARNEVLKVGKDAKQIIFETEDSDAYLKYTTRLPNYKPYVDGFKKDYGFSFDRMYYRDVLKRLSIVNETVLVRLNREQGTIEFSNSKFDQSIDLLQEKGLDTLGNDIHFKISLEVLRMAVLGNDDAFADSNVFIYLIPNGKKYTIYFADTTGTWFTTATVAI